MLTAIKRSVMAMMFLTIGILTLFASADSLMAGAPTKSSPPIEALTTKAEIREALARYVFLLNGDANGEIDLRIWAEQSFAADTIYQEYFPDGRERLLLSGRDAILQHYIGRLDEEKFGGSNPHLAQRLYAVNVVFDHLTTNSAQTRTASLQITSTRNTGDPRCPLCASEPTKAELIVFHDTWRKLAGRWVKVKTVLRYNS